jgi:integrase
VSGVPQLALVESRPRDLWRAALEGAVRAEFLVSPLVLPAGSPLAPPECGVPGCPRAGERAPWGRFETRLCRAHWAQWVKDDRPPRAEEWLSAQPPPRVLRPIERCAACGCRRSVYAAGLCAPHRHQWMAAGRPPLERFARSPRPVAVGDVLCVVPGCGFPACSTRGGTLCDTHLARFNPWRNRRAHLAEDDRSLRRYIEELGVRGAHAVLMQLPLPDTPLVALELRFWLQCRHDDGGGFISAWRWHETVERLNELKVQSLLDFDWPSPQRTEGRARVPRWMFYVNCARKVLLAFRVRCGLDDPWAPDLWHIQALPIDHAGGRLRNLDWRPIRPAWLRELCKRWARHRLRGGASFSHVNSIRLAVMRLVEFCEQAGWPLDDQGCLTRELFDAFLDRVRFLEAGVEHRRKLAYGVKQLFEDSHDLGWISLRHPRVYLRGELPAQQERLPRALPAELVVRLNQPGSLEPLTVAERAAVLVVLDCGLRATDTARLKLDAVISGSDGAPYLRYFNHKRRREAVVPLSDRAAEAIAAQRAWVRERYPDCEWLFPRLNANGRGKHPMGYSFIYATLHRWVEALELRDRDGEPSRPSPHAFRHTYATGLINNDVDLFSVQTLLDHDSPEMTCRYARMSNETLRRKWEQGQQRINIRGEVVPLDVDGELSDAAWAKEQISRAKQSLANGWCGLPLQQSCPHPNACLTCPAFLTDQTFLPQHREQLARTEQLIELGRKNGNERLVEINEATRVNLVAIIERTEQLERERHDNAEREKEETDASV